MKKLTISLTCLIVLSVVLIFAIKNKNYIRNELFLMFPKSVQSIFRVIVSNKNNTYKLNNDYNVKFLPETQSFNLNLKKIKIKNEKIQTKGIFKKKIYNRTPIYLDILNNKLVITFKDSEIFYVEIPNLINLENDDIINPIKLKHNLSNLEILDTLINDNSIYVSARIFENNCQKFGIFKSDLNLKKLNFKSIFKDEGCYVIAIQGGKMQFNKKLNKIIVSTAADIKKNLDRSDEKPQDNNSIMGKTLIIDDENKSYRIYSKGHRNIIGLYIDDYQNIIATENGPRGGDEINLIKDGFNYGWPIASYGEKDDYLPYKDNDIPYYKKNHKAYGFEEPIFAFVPSIGISEIIKVGNNFSNFWQETFLVGSLNGQHLYRIVFDDEYTKVKFYEKIYIGERIRDIKYYSKKRTILLALEESGSIGILNIE